MKNKFHNAYHLLVRTLASTKFSWFVIGLFIFQALWVALSFRFPMIYDEGFHMEAVRLFGGHILPVLTSQPESSDIFGTFINGGATIFHYLMSVPYGVVSLFTDSRSVHVIVLRVIGIGMFAGGIYLFMRLFDKIRIRRIYTNIAMLLFIMLPLVTLTAATVNYDNMLFLLTPAFLIVCVRILTSSKVIWYDYVFFVVIGCLASLAKFTFLPLFLAAIIFMLVFTFKSRGVSVFKLFLTSLKSSKAIITVLILTILVASVGVFSSVYIKNTLIYGSPQPSCRALMGEERCKNSGTNARNDSAKATKHTRPLQPTPEYLSSWVLQMVDWTNMTGSRTQTGTVIKEPLPVIYATTFISVFVGAAFILYAWRLMKRDVPWYFLVFIALTVVLSIFAQNTLTYLDLHVAYAVQPRYLLIVIPILMTVAVTAVAVSLRKRRHTLKVFILMATFILFTQGGGVVTHILQSDDSWYWQNQTVSDVNRAAKSVLEPLVKEN